MHPLFAPDDRCASGDATTIAIVAELLAITPALWSRVTLVVWAESAGFHFSIIGHETLTWIGPSALLRTLVARRFELMETVTVEAWFSFSVEVSRIGAREWQCNVRYRPVS
jgi:hypothetical protein